MSVVEPLPCSDRSRISNSAARSLKGDAAAASSYQAPETDCAAGASHQARMSRKRRSASEPKSGSRVSFARVVAGLVMPARKRAACLGVPSESGGSSARRREPRRRRRRRSAASARVGELLGASGQAVAAVAAGLGARLAEVGDERVHLAAVVGDEREDVLDPLGLRALAAGEALEQRSTSSSCESGLAVTV